jgi:tRNA-specific 2-thiouridylase
MPPAVGGWIAAMDPVLIAMSGGVDSAVAALLLKQSGVPVAAAYMKNWINEENVLGDCPWQEDIEDARAVAEWLGLDFEVVNLMEAYRERIVDYLLDGYRQGLTPNPDVMCNREIKFGVFLDHARERGFGAVATGHYAKRVDPDQGQPGLFEGADKNKDQSYFLAMMKPSQLARARFPIGDLTKPQVRELARGAGLPVADKKDSQGICFIGNIRMQDFLRHHVPDQPGPILRIDDDREVGQHRGLHLFTIGQRRGIGVPSNTDHRNYVVVGKDLVRQALLVAFEDPAAPGLYQSEARVHGLSWLVEPIRTSCRLEARVRYRDPRISIAFEPDAHGARIVFERPQRALAAGQILAFYRGEQLLGGAVFGSNKP